MGGSRSRSGCWTCRAKTAKKRCDQQRPSCGRCSRLNLSCDYSARPTLAERRRAQESRTLVHTRNAGDSTAIEVLPAVASSNSISLPLAVPQPPTPAPAACSLTLSTEDHEAIRYFRTDFARLHHTKDPSYSLISLMFKIAQKSPMVMHMVIALGLQEMHSHRRDTQDRSEQHSLPHYSSALRLLGDGLETQNTDDLDALLTALWLMLLYEQQFGDSECRAYSSHLTGVASLLQLRGRRFLTPCRLSIGTLHTSLGRTVESVVAEEQTKISIYSARMLLWITLLDAAAASSGVGGCVNAAMITLLLSTSADSADRPQDPIKAFSAFHRYSNSLYRLSWGDAYPQSELLDDVENRNVYDLLGQCANLRFMVAQLATYYRRCPEEAAAKSFGIGNSIDEVGERFQELIEVADELSMATDNSHRLVANMRAIVPMYHAVVLDFMRVTAFDKPLGERQRRALKGIMNLAYQSFKHGGDQATARVAWPLFLAVLETDDMLHRDWILDRFTAFRKYGKNYERARRFLEQTIPRQQSIGKRIDLRDQMEKLELFVLG